MGGKFRLHGLRAGLMAAVWELEESAWGLNGGY